MDVSGDGRGVSSLVDNPEEVSGRPHLKLFLSLLAFRRGER